jgi:hypothetical protein
MVEASQGIITMGSQGEGMNPAMKKHLELEIKILQNAPRDADKLEQLLKVKQRQKEEAMCTEDTQRLVTETEMLKVVLYLVGTKQQKQHQEGNNNKKKGEDKKTERCTDLELEVQRLAELETQMREQLERKYVLGLEDGYTDGYRDGLQDGWSHGFDVGIEDAWRQFREGDDDC